MKSERSIRRVLKSSDGRVRMRTITGVSLVVAVIALLVGVLPALATHVAPDPLNEGGGSGKCFVETGDLPSVATNEYHVNNPTGTHTSADGVVRITVSNTPQGQVFRFDVLVPGYVVYDVVVNGGPKSNHYDYDGNGGAVTTDTGLHSPNRGNSYHNLSHVNICYDVPGLVSVPCDVQPPIRAEGEGVLTIGDVTIFQNSLWDCTDKSASFYIEDDVATLEFLGDGTDTVAGRLDIYKQEDGPDDFVDLEYSRADGDPFFVVEWCDIREKDTIVDPDTGLVDGNEFDDVLDSDDYPSLVGVVDGGGDAIACKVAEDEDASGEQHNVVYFELEDPLFR